MKLFRAIKCHILTSSFTIAATMGLDVNRYGFVEEHEEQVTPQNFTENLFNVQGKMSKTKADILLIITQSKASFAADEPVLIDFVLENKNPKKSTPLLSWAVPCTEFEDSFTSGTPIDMSFFDIKNARGQNAEYIGALIKRAKPTEKDYKLLKPGDRIACTINLSDYFRFDSADNDNDYKIKYLFGSSQLSDPITSLSSSSSLEVLWSNSLTMKIEAREIPSRRDLHERKVQTLTSFRNCDPTKQTYLAEARNNAITAATAALTAISTVGQSSSTANCPRYSEWFGSFNSVRHSELKTGYETMVDKLKSASVIFDCGCSESFFAFVYPSLPFEIWLCNEFWNAAAVGTDSKMGTIIHEMTHFTITADTSDFAYGQTACRSLAINDPDKAVNNADSHEYIAENTPSLSCSSAPAPTTPLPTTRAPTTPPPTTRAPTTTRPTTRAPTTTRPTTRAPTTTLPTRRAIPTMLPTSGAPTTRAPITPFPSTRAPATPFPTTRAPATPFPTTRAPTTPFPTTRAPTTPFTQAPSPVPSCMSGRTRVEIKYSTETGGKEQTFKSVRDLTVGDTIQGLDESLSPAICTVEAIGHFGTGPVFGNYTKDHFILDSTNEVVLPNGINGAMEIIDKFAVLTSCPVGVDENGIGFTAVDSDFVGSDPLLWSDYVLIHDAILNIVKVVGPFVFSPSAYISMNKVSKYTKKLYDSMLTCAKDPKKCKSFENAAKDLFDNALTDEAKVKVMAKYPTLGVPGKKGSISATVSKGESVIVKD